MYLHFDIFEPRRTPTETRSAWMLDEARATARLQRLERRRARRRRLVAAVMYRRSGTAPAATSCTTSAGVV